MMKNEHQLLTRKESSKKGNSDKDLSEDEDLSLIDWSESGFKK